MPIDYVGAGNGQEVLVTIVPGDIGADIATTLHDAGVTMTFDAFYELLLGMETQPNFIPGTYALQQEMSAQAALDALLDPGQPPGVDRSRSPRAPRCRRSFERLSAGHRDLRSRTSRPPPPTSRPSACRPTAVSLEGYLFPATYQFDPGVTAHDILQQLVESHVPVARRGRRRRSSSATRCSRSPRSSSARRGSTSTTSTRSRASSRTGSTQGMRLRVRRHRALRRGNYADRSVFDHRRRARGSRTTTTPTLIDGLPIGPIGLPATSRSTPPCIPPTATGCSS